MGRWLLYADRTTASRFPKIRGLHRDPSASARPSPSLRRVEALRYFFGISSVPLPFRIVLVDINTAGPRFFFNCMRAQKGKYHGAYSESRRRKGCTCLLSKDFLVEPGFTFLCRTTLVCAEISILFHWSTLDQKVNARSLGSFIGAPSTSQAGSPIGVVDCTIPNSPRSNITLVIIFLWNAWNRVFFCGSPLLSVKQE
jgi:hypothetical protein